MSDGNTYFNVVRFVPDSGGDDGGSDGPEDASSDSGGNGAALLLEEPWKITAGIKPDFNRAIVSYEEYNKIGDIGGTGQILFCFNDDSSGDVTLSDITLLDAEVVEYGTPKDKGSPGPVKFRLVFVDKRYQFVDPRGGRLMQGIVNPSTFAAIDPSIMNNPPPQTLSQLVTLCLTAMGLSIDVPEISQHAPMDLKWFGTHAPSELEKLLAYANCIMVLQTDGSFEIHTIGDGSDPTIPGNMALPAVTLDGADGRGKTVVFTSFPTQVAAVLTEDDLDDGDLEFVGRNQSGAWVPYTTLYGSAALQTVIPQLNLWNDHRAAFTHIRLNPSSYNPLVSPILLKTWDFPYSGDTDASPTNPDDGSDANNPNHLPAQIPIIFNAHNVPAFDFAYSLWINTDLLPVGIDRLEDGNVFTLSRQLIKLKGSGGGGSPTSVDSALYSNAVSINLDNDLEFRFSIRMSDWNSSSGCWLPTYFYVGFSGTGSSNTKLEAADAQAAMKKADTIVVPMPDLQAIQYGFQDDDGNPSPIYNKMALEDRCQQLANRYLKSANTQPRQLAGVGFIDFTFDGTLSEVRIDQKQVITTFRMNGHFRPTSSYLATEFEQLRKVKESHPHEAKTQGSRSAMGYASSVTIAPPVQPMTRERGFVGSVSPVVVKIIASLGGGFYTGGMYSGQCNGSSGSNLTGLTAFSACTVVNGPELGTSSSAAYLNVNAWLGGFVIGFNGSSSSPLVLTQAVSLGPC